MKKTSLLLTIGAVALLAVNGQAMAQTGGAAPAAAPSVPTPPAPPTFGAPIQGQCVIDTGSALATSNMGKAASDRLAQLKGVVDTELNSDGQALDAEYKTLAGQQAAATAATATQAVKSAWQAKADAWEKKREAFQEKVQQRNQEMQYTQQQVMQALFQKMIPQINQVVTANHCSTVIPADSLLHYDYTGADSQTTTFTYANPAMDITSAVVQKMNATNELLPTFDRVHLDQQQGAAAPTH